MKFMMLVKGDKDNSGPPSPELAAAMGKLREEIIQSGSLLDSGGLLPSAMGARIKARRGKLSFTDGPFTEVKEMVGGYAVMRFNSKQEAIEAGKRFMQVHVDVLGEEYEGELEIRQMMEL